jgi:hypothetical protein
MPAPLLGSDGGESPGDEVKRGGRDGVGRRRIAEGLARLTLERAGDRGRTARNDGETDGGQRRRRMVESEGRWRSLPSRLTSALADLVPIRGEAASRSTIARRKPAAPQERQRQGLILQPKKITRTHLLFACCSLCVRDTFY